MANGLFKTDAQLSHHDLVGQADTQREPVICGRLGSECLARQYHWVSRESGYYGGTEFYIFDRLRNDCQNGKGIETASGVFGQPVTGEAFSLSLIDILLNDFD
jgi:hypothetical protein